MTSLRRYAVRAPAAPANVPPAQRCEMCAAELGGGHRHVVALDDRAIRCVCRPCGLLFASTGAGAGRIRAVPERYLTDQSRRVADEDWEVLRIPVLPVFLFVNSDLDRVVACYPSPAGATESRLDLDGWAGLREAYPLLRMPVADVEAVYVTRMDAGLEAYLVPIDACFEMVGRVRSLWRGPDGGEAVRRSMAQFRQALRDRSRSLRGADGSLRRGTPAG